MIEKLKIVLDYFFAILIGLFILLPFFLMLGKDGRKIVSNWARINTDISDDDLDLINF